VEKTVPAETNMERTPLDRPAILALVKDRLADILEIEPSDINEGDSFADDLDADSLALIELVESLEEEVNERHSGFRIEDDDLEDLKTVRDAVDFVDSSINSWASRPTSLRPIRSRRFICSWDTGSRTRHCLTERWRIGRGVRRMMASPTSA